MKKVIVTALIIISLAVFAGTAAAEAAAEKETVTYKGYLMDKACADMGKGMDGSDVVNAPWDHTKMCLMAGPCKASGYGVSVKEGAAFTFIKFDKDGDDIAWAEIEKFTGEDNFEIEVEGVLEGDVLVVNAITTK